MRRRFLQVLTAVPLALLLSSRPAAAQWVGWFQWGTQGSYVHQFAHILFFGAMLFFIREMHRGGLNLYPGFRCLIWACWILAFWNLDAVVGHTIEWNLTNPVILGHGIERRLLMENVQTWVFYITKFNHFFWLIPAFYLFYRGLKALPGEFRGRE
jgi:hypothetical protein